MCIREIVDSRKSKLGSSFSCKLTSFSNLRIIDASYFSLGKQNKKGEQDEV